MERELEAAEAVEGLDLTETEAGELAAKVALGPAVVLDRALWASPQRLRRCCSTAPAAGLAGAVWGAAQRVGPCSGLLAGGDCVRSGSIACGKQSPA